MVCSYKTKNMWQYFEQSQCLYTLNIIDNLALYNWSSLICRLTILFFVSLWNTFINSFSCAMVMRFLWKLCSMCLINFQKNFIAIHLFSIKSQHMLKNKQTFFCLDTECNRYTVEMIEINIDEFQKIEKQGLVFYRFIFILFTFGMFH